MKIYSEQVDNHVGLQHPSHYIAQYRLHVGQG